MVTDTNQEKLIIAEVLEGHTDQYRLLVERYHRGLINHLANLLHNQTQAEDIAQEAFLQAYRKLSQFNDSYAFSTWLYKIADNLAYRYLKQTRTTTQFEDIEESIPDEHETPAEQFDRELNKESVRKAIKALEPNYQQVVTLYYWEDFSYEQIAQVLDKPIGTVRTWLYRAKEEIRKELHGQTR